MVTERARGSKLDVYKRKKGRVTNKTQHTLTMKEAGKSTTQTFSNREIAKPQPLVPQTSQSKNANTPKQKKDDKQTKTDEQQNPKKRKEKKIPTEFKRLSNWRELIESDEEETDKRRIERKQTNQPKQANTPIKATVNWEKPHLTKEEPESEIERNSTTSDERPKRSRTAPVMICGVENANEEGERGNYNLK